MEAKEILKKTLMAKIANLNCYKIYVTDDNPRRKVQKNKKKYLKNDSKKNVLTLAVERKQLKSYI